MGIKTVCGDLFNLLYKQSLQEEGEVSENLDQRVAQLERAVHSMRLFQYLLSIAKELGIEPPKENTFSQTFRELLREVLYKFCQVYIPSYSEKECRTLVETFLNNAKTDIGNISDHLEDLIILLLGLVVDKTLSETYTVTKIKNLFRELQGKNIPLL